ncbi:MAG: EAL domain-containing protein [Aeromicrobium sp.]
MARLWQVYAAVFVTLIVIYLALPWGTTADVIYLVIGLSCVVAILAGIALHRPASPLAWYAMAAGQASWVAGDALYAMEQHAETVSFPAVSDIGYVASFPIAAFGVLVLIRAQRRDRDLAGLVDTLIVTVGVALLSWAFIAGPILGDPTTSRFASVLAVTYPALDIVFLALVVRLMTGQRDWTPSFCLLVGATLTILAADTGFASSLGDSSYVPALDVLWLMSYVLWGAAALHPDMVNLAAPAVHDPTPFTRRRLAMLGGVVMLPAALFAARESLGLDVGLGTLMIGAAILSLLVMARMACDIEEILLTTQQRDTLQKDVFRRATQDEVTGLPNRPSFEQLVGSALERGVRDGIPSAIVVIEVSGIGHVARQHGHAYGDLMLSEVARRIEGVIGHDGCVARIGPSQFGILVERLEPQADLPPLAHALLTACRTPFSTNGQLMSLMACAGVAVSPAGSNDAEALLRDAALATTSARAGGDGCVEFFDAALRAEVTHRRETEIGLVEAIRSNQLELHYQPIMAVERQVITGYEALVRWNRPGHGLLYPDSFIPVAERSDLICDLDRWVLKEATRQLAAWTRTAPRDCAGLTVAVNISGRNLAGATIVDDVADALRSSGLNPAQLTLEITETMLVDVPRASQRMSALRELGVSISIDDFGTGYTSIGQLGLVPADIIKIDRSLVTSGKDGARELLALIVQAGHASGLRVVAEGIEQLEELTTVTDLGYDSVQGYLIGRPQPVRDDQPPRLGLTAPSTPTALPIPIP